MSELGDEELSDEELAARTEAVANALLWVDGKRALPDEERDDAIRVLIGELWRQVSVIRKNLLRHQELGH